MTWSLGSDTVATITATSDTIVTVIGTRPGSVVVIATPVADITRKAAGLLIVR